MTTQVKRLSRPIQTSEQHELWVKYDRIGNELRDLSYELGAIYWAAFGVSEICADGENVLGIQHIAHRLEERLKALAEEVRL